MVKKAQAQYIKHLWENEGNSLREISQITGLCFQTVQKYAYKDDWTPETHRVNKSPKHYPVLGSYITYIDEWLKFDLKESRKQQHTAKRIYKKKDLSNQALNGFLPLMQPLGHAQLDFGQFKYYDAIGNSYTGHALILSFPYSNAAFAQVFKGKNQECLLEGLKRIFAFIGGVPKCIKTDNMSAAVARIINNDERILTNGFSHFMLHYRFKAEFCSPGAGNEKGNVENRVGYLRRNLFVPVPIIKDIEKYNADLFGRCVEDMNRPHYKHGKHINELWQEEKEALSTLPEQEYQVFRYENARINNYGCIELDTNHYGVSPELNGRNATLKLFYDKIEIYHEHALLSGVGLGKSHLATALSLLAIREKEPVFLLLHHWQTFCWNETIKAL